VVHRSLSQEGARGTLLFTGATASIRGNTTTSLLSSGKHALRALSQSLNKEFGKENIHICHAIIDGYILNDFTRKELGEKADNPDAVLTPEVIAQVGVVHNHPRARWDLRYCRIIFISFINIGLPGLGSLIVSRNLQSIYIPLIESIRSSPRSRKVVDKNCSGWIAKVIILL
jgi:NAD(P)-dependent dehydrogenase (short-subunit alcohol dehydrogenase family)